VAGQRGTVDQDGGFYLGEDYLQTLDQHLGLHDRLRSALQNSHLLDLGELAHELEKKGYSWLEVEPAEAATP